jgi:hypothetical protein
MILFVVVYDDGRLIYLNYFQYEVHLLQFFQNFLKNVQNNHQLVYQY